MITQSGFGIPPIKGLECHTGQMPNTRAQRCWRGTNRGEDLRQLLIRATSKCEDNAMQRQNSDGFLIPNWSQQFHGAAIKGASHGSIENLELNMLQVVHIDAFCGQKRRDLM